MDRYVRSWFITVMLLSVLLLPLTACGIPIDLSVSGDTKDILNRAIAALETQPGTWKTVLQDTIDHFHDKANDVAQKVQTLLDDSISYAETSFQCGVDFIGTRGKQVLQYLLAQLQGESPPPPPGKVCN